MLTKQEAFDKVARGIIAQGGPSLDPDGACRYHGVDGRRCAAGHLIPDDQYKPTFERICVPWSADLTGNDDQRALSSCLLAVHEDIKFIKRLQQAHDGATNGVDTDEDFMKGWRERMRLLAMEYELSPAVLA